MSSWPAINAFNGLDWVVVVIVVLSALVSLWRGFSREALSLAGWLAAFVAANLAATEVSSWMAGLLANPTGRYIVAWTCIFVAVLVLAGLLSKLFARLVRASGLGLIDRLLGTVFGALRGVLITLVLLFVLREAIPRTEQQWLAESQLVPRLDPLLDWSLRAFEDVRAGKLPALAT